MTDDPEHDFLMQDFDNEMRLQSHPFCAICGERIDQDSAFHYQKEDIYICDSCLEDNREYLDKD